MMTFAKSTFRKLLNALSHLVQFQEEAQRLAEEARKREEEERRELEKVMAVREEQKRKQKEALEAHTAMREKAESIPINIHLGGCHALTKCKSSTELFLFSLMSNVVATDIESRKQRGI